MHNWWKNSKIGKFFAKREILFSLALGLIIGACEPLIDSSILWAFKFIITAITILVFFQFFISKTRSKKKNFFILLGFFYGMFFVFDSWIPHSALVPDLPMWFGSLYFLGRFFCPSPISLARAIFLLPILFIDEKKFCFLKALSFALLWSVGEWFVSFAFTGLPYDYLSWNWWNFKPAMQIVSLPFVNVFVLSGITLLFILSFAILLQKKVKIYKKIPLFLVMILPLVLSIIYGYNRLENSVGKSQNGYYFTPAVNRKLAYTFYLFQGDASTYMAYTPESAAARKSDLINMAKNVKLESEGKDVFVFYESALQYYVGSYKFELQDVLDVIPENGYLITGHLSSFAYIDQLKDKLTRKVFNSISSVDNKGNVLSYYDKEKLVPFGEYIPAWFKIFLPENVANRGFSEGNNLDRLYIDKDMVLQPRICSEINYPFPKNREYKNSDGDYVKAVEPNFAVNILNEGWFGKKVLDKDLINTMFQAVHNRLPIMRVANTGYSSMIDIYGNFIPGDDGDKIVSFLQKDRQAVLKVKVYSVKN